MCGQQLSRNHPFKLVSRPDTHQPINDGAALLVTTLLVRMLEPKRSHGLMSENFVPVVRSRSADVFQKALPVIRVISNDRRCFLVTATARSASTTSG